MRLANIRITNVRRLENVAVDPGPFLNVLLGPNGSGKTSFLEAIHFLSLGRSFRTRRAGAVIRDGTDTLTVFGEVSDEEGRRVSSIGIEKGATETRLRVDGQQVKSVSALARRLPVMVVAPEGLKALLEGSEHRRRLLDWTLFHVEPRYLEVLQHFGRVLRQRNASLREPAGLAKTRELDVWDEQLAGAGELLDTMRRNHIESSQMKAIASRILNSVLNEPVSWEYRRGWASGNSLRDALTVQRDRDRQVGFTTIGPHRADIVWRTKQGLARESLSRGQGRLLVMAFEIAQAAYVMAHANTRSILLVDDLSTELDISNMQGFLAQVDALGLQTFISSVLDALTTLMHPRTDVRLFHVERGEVVSRE